jgi:hypothetical protein
VNELAAALLALILLIHHSDIQRRFSNYKGRVTSCLGMFCKYRDRKWFGMKLLWPVFMYSSIICLEGLKQELKPVISLDNSLSIIELEASSVWSRT